MFIPSGEEEPLKNRNADAKSEIFSDKKPNIFVEEEKTNVASVIITITQDKLENILLKYNKTSTKFRWAIPCPVFLSVFLTLLTTSSFKAFLGISPEIWHALFYLVAIIFAGWTVFEFFLLFKNREKLSLDFLINKIKGG